METSSNIRVKFRVYKGVYQPIYKKKEKIVFTHNSYVKIEKVN